MMSTGIEVLDERLGGLQQGRYFIVSGPPGTGKTSLALHFLGAGLEAGERAVLLTQDDPDDILAQAAFLGYDLRPAAEDDRLAVLQFRLDFAHNYTRFSDPDRVARELAALVGDGGVDRFVIDSVVPFVEGDETARDLIGALAHLLERVGGTTYLTLPGDVGDAHYWRFYDRIVPGAAGIFHLERGPGQARELSLRKLRQAARSTQPLRFVLAPGAGVVEETAPPGRDLPEELLRRVVLLNTTARAPDELLAALDRAYELEVYDDVGSAFGELAGGAFGALAVVLDPRSPDASLDLVRQLRKLGSGAPVILLSAQEELRASTRARALRSGADDMLTFDTDLREVLARVEVCRARGHRPAGAVTAPAENLVVQPMGDDGLPLPVDEADLRRTVRHQVENTTHPFFALVTLRPDDVSSDEAWQLLCWQVRVREGDLVARTPDGRILLYLHDIGRRHVHDLLARVFGQQPSLRGSGDVEVYSYPVDRVEVLRWLERPAAAPLAGAAR